MENRNNYDEDKAMSATTAARLSGSDLNSGQSNLPNVRDSLGRTGDPFLEDMQSIANDSGLDGNAQVNSPQASPNDDWSTGNSR
jgi:hypothetical protein